MDEHQVESSSSSKRRERLLALRSAANASPAADPPLLPAGSLLPDPDPDPAGDHASSPHPHPRSPQRFDYYTNPAAAFSSSSSYSGGGSNPTWSHRRKSPPNCYPTSPAPPPPYAGPGNYGSNYPLPHQHLMAPSPIHSPSLMAQDAPGSSQWRSPMQFQDPMSGYQGTPPGAPPPWGLHSGSPARGYYPNSPSFGFRHPNPGRGGSPMNYGPRGSPHSSYGRGRGQNYNNSPGSWGRGGRGGVGFQNRSGWQDRRSFFNQSMVEDPWQDLQPIVGNILIPRGRAKSWLPESLCAKKETPAQGQIKLTSSGLSLAEYLDLSFNEASNEM
ncbi:protein SICKLE-like isoform X2 [Phragmites australis]|uniref:protein SICKLE-like isoform X2 n=1 Tax=Phragmites australis TaxID=29695 RepID=UPI002D79AE4B|nr:protein SICKLE-like isoform X2 [Phragmites australis]